MDNRAATGIEQLPRMSTNELRSHYLVEDLFHPGEVHLVYSHEDRVVLGGATPTGAPLTLAAPPALRTATFFERREAGLVNVGGPGTVVVDATRYDMAHGACLYIGRGAGSVEFVSADPATPAKFYLFSAPAHATYPTTLTEPGHGDVRELGDSLTANRRTLNRYIHADGVQSCQVVMGVTALHPGSVWNTMPSHTHDRRTECYLYFDLPADARIVHLCGEPTETRHMIVANEQAIISPSWSIHSGVGTAAYTFVWAMAGENKDYDDMDTVQAAELR